MFLSKAFLFSQMCAVASSSSLRGGDAPERELRTRIIGGNEATEGRYSYAVSLQDDVGHFCGGSLIAPDVVLSASHCMQYETGYKVVIGRHDLSTLEGEVRTVISEITHPGYNWGTTDDDFMILILDQATTEDVDLVEVSPNVVPVGAAVTVMGWGDTHPAEDNRTLAEELMETEVFVVSNEECERSNGTIGGTEIDGTIVGGYDEDYHDQITENMMCAKDNREDSCQGDSGGPLVIRSGSGDIQVGVVSWGVSCAHEDFPGVYARVSAQYEWIRNNVCDESSDPPASFDCDNRVDDNGGWTKIAEEDFTYGFGLFNNNGNDAKYYTRARDRTGVVRITDGEMGISTLTSNQISLEHNPFAKIRVVFSLYSIKLEQSDDLCLDYELDGGAITGEKCWSRSDVFVNDIWYDDMSFEFAASNANSLRIRFKVRGDDEDDGVFIDSVIVQGQA